jgi:predicted aldo/keto reductase-like oxidoreductase
VYKSKEMKDAVEAIKKTGKVRFVGFSTHDPMIAEQLQNAAKGGFIDVIMLKFSPWLGKDEPLYKALDACHKANIGLVSMKQISGQATRIAQERIPSLKARNLTPAQGLLHAIWSDERFSSSCVTMRNLDQTHENADALRRFEPLKQAELDELRDALLAAGPTMCPNCQRPTSTGPAPTSPRPGRPAITSSTSPASSQKSTGCSGDPWRR